MKSLIKHAMTLATGILITLFALPYLGMAGESFSPPAQLAPVASLAEQERLFSQLYANVAPSVVSINLTLRLESNQLFASVASGSGFVIDTDGHIVTNAHVITLSSDVVEAFELDGSQETRIEVRMFDGTIAAAEVVGVDRDSDLAVLRVAVAPERLHPIGLGNSTSLSVGQVVVAMGNPFSNDWTLTTGIISALNRSIVGLEGFSIGGVIQTDAAINPGNSGGPLVNMQGQVIGVNSQINTESGSSSGIGFAVPSNLVNKVAQSLIQRGSVEYSFIGIQSRPVDLNLMEAFSLPNNLRGVAVLGIFQDAPAAQAGLHALSRDSVDVITAINGLPIGDFDELIAYLAINTNPGDTIMLTVYRNGEVLQLPVTLTHRPSQQ